MNCNQTRSPFSSFQKLANMCTAPEVIFIVALLSTINQFSYNQKLSLGLLNERSFPLRVQPFNRKLPSLQLVMAVEGKTRFSTAPRHYYTAKTNQAFLFQKEETTLKSWYCNVLITLLNYYLIFSVCLADPLFTI